MDDGCRTSVLLNEERVVHQTNEVCILHNPHTQCCVGTRLANEAMHELKCMHGSIIAVLIVHSS